MKPAEIVDRTIRARRSVRAFLDTPVEMTLVRHILDVAARAPSGTNTQPWQVHVLTGSSLSAVCDAVTATFLDPNAVMDHKEAWAYYPEVWCEPYLGRRRKIGFDLYGLLGLGKDDKSGMQAQHARNFRFFDAPVGIFFTIDGVMGRGSLLDYGMFMENIMISAVGHGLATCPQAAFNQFHRIISRHLGLDANQVLVCAMALGYEDKTAPENTLKTERAVLDEFVRFYD